MTRPSQRRSYLESSLPSEWLEYSTGSRSNPFISTGAASGSLGRKNPTLIGAIFDKKSAFESKNADPSTLFERFLNIQRNPQSLIESRLKLPAGFTQALSVAPGLDS